MNNYETIFLIKDNITDEQRNSVVEEIKNFLVKKGKISKVDDLGKRMLAYKIQNHQYAYYIVIYFSGTPDIIPELERKYRINENILKFIIVKQDN